MRSESSLIPYAPGRLTGSPVVVFAPHPDDEVFGCGGALVQAVEAGAAIHVIIVTDGSAQGDPGTRREESRRAASILGLPEPEMWGFPDRGLEPGDDALLAKLRETIRSREPSLVLAPSPAEIHPDHRALALAVYRVLQEIGGDVEERGRWDALQLASYEVSAVLRPNLLVDVTAQWDRLMEAVREFGSQLDAAPYLEVYGAIRTLRRLTLPAGIERAEAYHVVDMPYIREHGLLRWAAAQGPAEGLAGESGELEELRAEVVRLRAVLDEIHASKTWRLHSLLERIRGRR